MKMNSREKGSALITVILVVLVLTMVGVASLFFMTTEERIANVTRLEKAAFYAAETGLREAERSVLTQFQLDPQLCDTLLGYPETSQNVLNVPNGGTTHRTAVVFTDSAIAAHQDPATGVTGYAGEMWKMDITGNEGYTVTYDIYVRNDDDEVSATLDNNNMVSIVAVGTVTTGTGQTIRKFLEEVIGPATMSGAISPSESTGGTGAVNVGVHS